MEHLAIMKKGYIEKILSGEKKIESRFSINRITPFNNISEDDKVYMQETGKEVTAMFEVEKVLFFDNLTEAKIEKIRIEYGKDICAGEDFWKLKQHSKYATLIYIKNARKITPFKVNKNDRSAFKTVNKLKEELIINKRTIIKHPHDCANNKHYFVFDGNTHCQFCNSKFLYTEIMKQKPEYKTVANIMRESMWNDDWLNADLDNVAKNKLPKINKTEIKKILIKSIRSYQPDDGKQTPYYGNPVYYAQHSLGCCCRKCIEKFYSIPKDKVLSDDDLDYFTNLIIDFIKEKQNKLSNTFPYRKILIVGCGGAGKSTLAVEMGQKFNIPVIHLDKIWWLPNWKNRTQEEFDLLLEKELNKNLWIIEGNYNRTFLKRLEYAELCIFLDYPQDLCINSVHERVEKFRGQTRPDMADGCEEQFDPEFEEWIKSYQDKIRPSMLETLKSANVPYKIFTTRNETSLWLNSFNNKN
ncbi:MAG: DUF4186 family protein [Clostridia bacterium]|nr:DUF4186 family protein [Clostridia bacterium]